jgi:hypothetical protein
VIQPIHISATQRTPEVVFDPTQRTVLIRGESYPEDPFEFYAQPLDAIYSFLGGRHDGQIVFEFDLVYFNSSSAKVLIDLFCRIEMSAQEGNQIFVRWLCEQDDDNMQELGTEFAQELSHAEFRIDLHAAD